METSRGRAFQAGQQCKDLGIGTNSVCFRDRIKALILIHIYIKYVASKSPNRHDWEPHQNLNYDISTLLIIFLLIEY